MNENPLSIVTSAMGITEPLDALRIANAIDVLRDGEGNSITFICDSPDFNGQPNSKVICNGDWTGWQDREFTGATVFEALGSAMAANTLWERHQLRRDPFNPQGNGSNRGRAER